MNETVVKAVSDVQTIGVAGFMSSLIETNLKRDYKGNDGALKLFSVYRRDPAALNSSSFIGYLRQKFPPAQARAMVTNRSIYARKYYAMRASEEVVDYSQRVGVETLLARAKDKDHFQLNLFQGLPEQVAMRELIDCLDLMIDTVYEDLPFKGPFYSSTDNMSDSTTDITSGITDDETVNYSVYQDYFVGD